jgi:hypothetical protein
MNAVFCFALKHTPGSRLRSAIVFARWGVDDVVLLSLEAKWKNAKGGYTVPVACIEEAARYVERDGK